MPHRSAGIDFVLCSKDLIPDRIRLSNKHLLANFLGAVMFAVFISRHSDMSDHINCQLFSS